MEIFIKWLTRKKKLFGTLQTWYENEAIRLINIFAITSNCFLLFENWC